MGSLTKRAVDAAAPGEVIWDDELKGFGLRVSKGGAKTFVLKYRVQKTQAQRWLTVGRYGALTPDAARKLAKVALGDVAAGGDPAGERVKDRAVSKAKSTIGDTLADFAETYRTKYSEVEKKQASRDADRFHLKNHIIPALGSKRLEEITADDVEDLHQSLADRPYSANRMLALLSHLYTMAAKWKRIPRGVNPAAGVERFREEARERFLSVAELRRLGRVLAFVDRKGEAPYTVAALRLLIFTGARLNEILKMKWSFIDYEARLIRLPDIKTGPKTIPLAPAALEILQALRDRQEGRGNPFVIVGAKPGQHLVNLQKSWRRIRKAALIPDVRIHDLRHSYASAGVTNNLSLPIIGSLLGHKEAATTARYAHVADDPRLAAADAIAASISARMGSQRGEVIPLRRQNG